MLNQDISRVNSFANDKSVLVDMTWNTYENKSIGGKVVSFFKQQADAILTEDQVREGYFYSVEKGLYKQDAEKLSARIIEESKKIDFDDESGFPGNKMALFQVEQGRQNNAFSYIADKNIVIKENNDFFITSIAENGKISSDSMRDLLKGYFDENLISLDVIKSSLEIFFKFKAQSAYIKAKSPLLGITFDGQTKIINEYHDLDHDMLDEEKAYISYGIYRGYFSEEELKVIDNILENGGDDLGYFMRNNLNKYLLNLYLNKLLTD